MLVNADIMADPNVVGSSVQAPVPPTRTDEEILPFNKWVAIGKSNYYLKADKPQNHPIFKMALDILKQTNFFQAFTASATIPSIYIQQFWNTISYDKVADTYRCQLDEQWVNINKETLGSALQIMPTGDNIEFTAPPNPAVILNFVNELGYPTEVSTLSSVITNDMYQPWRAIISLINLCLTGKTSGYERLRAPSLQILWGIFNGKNIDFVERIWEEFSHSIHSFLKDNANFDAHKDGKKKSTKLLIPSIRFTKLIITSLQRTLHFHPRSGLALHQTSDESTVRYLKYTAKGTPHIIFGMAIPEALLVRNIFTAQYYDEYLKLLSESQDTLVNEPPKSTKSGKSTSKKRKGVSTSSASSGSTKKVKRTTGSKKSSSMKIMSKETGRDDTPEVEQISQKEEEIIHLATQESLKDIYIPHVPLVKGVSINEPDSGKRQQLQHVEGRGKEVATEEQAAQTLLKISSPASESTTSQFILKRRYPEPSTTEASPDKTVSHSPSLVQQASSSESEANTDL